MGEISNTTSITMSIIFDARSIDSKKPTGVGIFSSTLLTHLQKSEIAQDLIVFSNTSHKKILTLPPDITHIHTRIPNKILNGAITLTARPHLDTYIGNRHTLPNPLTFFAPNLQFIALKKETRLVLTVHDLSFYHIPEWYSPKMRLWHTLVNPQKLIERADTLIAVSHTTKEDLINTFHVPENRIKVVYPGIKREDPNPSILQNIPKRFILCISSIEPRKNIELLFEAFANLKKNPRHHDVALVLAGPIGYHGKKILQHAKKLGSSFHYLGYVPSGIKARLLAQCAVFVYPSRFEGFGFPPLEAMAAGTPVVASMIPSLQEVLGGNALLANPYRSDEFTSGFDALLTDDTLQAHFRAAGRAHVQKFSWETTAHEITAILKG